MVMEKYENTASRTYSRDHSLSEIRAFFHTDRQRRHNLVFQFIFCENVSQPTHQCLYPSQQHQEQRQA